ncbi:MAG: hypothetical protein GY754_15835 [bacterium]|nr:hypothetical protein [bacterium]
MKLFLGRNILTFTLVVIMAFAGCEAGLDTGNNSGEDSGESGFSFSDLYSRMNALEDETKRLKKVNEEQAEIITRMNNKQTNTSSGLAERIETVENRVGEFSSSSLDSRIGTLEGRVGEFSSEGLDSRITNIEGYVGYIEQTYDKSLTVKLQDIEDNIDSYSMADFNKSIDALNSYVGNVAANPGNGNTISARIQSMEDYVGDGNSDPATAITSRVKSLEDSVGDGEGGLIQTVNIHGISISNLQGAVEGHTTAIDNLDGDVSNLNTTFDGVSRLTDPYTGQPTIRFSGVNVQIVNGLGYTNGGENDFVPDGTKVNGLGNLIVGYNEVRVDMDGNPTNTDDRSGSHNIIVGTWNNYSSYGGLVAGYRNNIYGIYSSVSAGYTNTTEGTGASVSGGCFNKAIESRSSVTGGRENTASASYSTVGGGRYRNITTKYGY